MSDERTPVDYAKIKWGTIPLPGYNQPYHVVYWDGRVETHVRPRSGGVRRVRPGWAIRKMKRIRRGRG